MGPSGFLSSFIDHLEKPHVIWGLWQWTHILFISMKSVMYVGGWFAKTRSFIFLASLVANAHAMPVVLSLLPNYLWNIGKEKAQIHTGEALVEIIWLTGLATVDLLKWTYKRDDHFRFTVSQGQVRSSKICKCRAHFRKVRTIQIVYPTLIMCSDPELLSKQRDIRSWIEEECD